MKRAAEIKEKEAVKAEATLHQCLRTNTSSVRNSRGMPTACQHASLDYAMLFGAKKYNEIAYSFKKTCP